MPTIPSSNPLTNTLPHPLGQTAGSLGSSFLFCREGGGRGSVVKAQGGCGGDLDERLHQLKPP